MSGQGRPATYYLIGLLASVFVCPASTAQTIEWPLNVAAHRDCELNDIYFRDAQHGLATGNRGLLLTTEDGGSTWQSLELDVHCDLESICFAGQSLGWIAGGYRLPHASGSQAVILETRDGGRSWQSVAGLDIPRINKVLFWSAQDGVAIGESTSTRPGGIFLSNDGGRSWSTTPDAARAAWQTADLFPDNRLVIADHRGTIGHGRQLDVNPADHDSLKPGAINEFCLLDDQYGFAVGDLGQVAQTTDGGRSWKPADVTTAWPARSIDLQTICNSGNRLWIAGDPGGLVFRLEAGQRTWTRHRLPVKSPVTALHFVDEQTGWAVSRLGDIIHTADGGETWSVQRRGGRGVALLQLATEPAGFCPELFARFCADQGFVGAAILVQPPSGKSVNSSLADVRQALGRVGGSFTVRAPADLVPGLGLPDPADRRFREYLVRQIRTLQPRVISVNADSADDDPSFDLAGEILAAVNQAADPREFAHQTSELDLPVWQVSKVVMVDQRGGGDLGISSQEYLTRMSCLVGDYAAPSRHLLGRSMEPPRLTSLQTIYTSPLVSGHAGTLLESIERLDGRVPKRDERRAAPGNMVSMRQLASKSKRLESLLKIAAQADGTTSQFSNGLAKLCSGLDEATAGVWLFELGQECLTRGDTAFARFTFSYLLDQYRRHPLALVAALKLYDDFSSREMAMLARQQIERAHAARPIAGETPEEAAPAPRTRPVTRIQDGIATTVWEPVDEPAETPKTPVQNVAFLDDQLSRLLSVRNQQAYSASQSIGVLDPGGFDSGSRVLSRIRLNQKLTPGVSLIDQLKKEAAKSPGESISSSAALRELTVAREGPAAAARRFGFDCAPAAERPWLDGRLDDAVWNQARQLESFFSLTDAEGNVTETVLVACDDKFLFVAVTCRRKSGQRYPPRANSRQHDAELAATDHMILRIDTDRDYLTGFQFLVDSTGRVAERCGTAAGWNPRWYVANRLDKQNWYAEIAIPLDEIRVAGAEPLWSMSVTRRAVGQQSSTWWQTDLSGATAPQWSLRVARRDEDSAPDPVHPDAWAMVLMPWQGQPDVIETDLPVEASQGIRNLPADN